MNLPPMAQQFILHFGDMGGKWGINRIAAQVFALLYLSQEPLDAAAICNTLNFSRSHVGSALKDLERWRLIRAQRPQGGRRDYFSAIDDVLEIARVLAEERRKREIEPTREMLRQAVRTPPANDAEKYMHGKIKEMHDLLIMLTDWHDELQIMETRHLSRLLRFGSKAAALYMRAVPKSEKNKKG